MTAIATEYAKMVFAYARTAILESTVRNTNAKTTALFMENAFRGLVFVIKDGVERTVAEDM